MSDLKRTVNVAYLDEHLCIFFLCAGSFGLVRKWQGRELVLVVELHPVLHIFEDRVKAFYSVPIQQAEVAYHSGHCSGRVGLVNES